MKCCTGKVLRVDLTAGTTTVEAIPDEVYEAVSEDFNVIERIEDNGWVCLVAKIK